MIDQSYAVTAGSSSVRLSLALKDLKAALRLWPVWTMLGWIDIKQRYRRAFIGPFWITLSMGVMVGGLGVVYGALFQIELTTYLPFVGGGFIVWFFLSSCLIEGAATFVQAEGLLKQGGLPLGLHVFRLIWRNIIVFFHNILVMIGIYIWLWHVPWATLPWGFVGLVLVTINLIWIVLVLGPLCTRFRDLSPIVANVVQLLFFLTPIVFEPERLKMFSWIVRYNPFYYMLEAIRGPFIGHDLHLGTIEVLIAMAIVGWCVALAFFARARRRIVFWI